VPPRLDLTGQRLGLLTVLGPAEARLGKRTVPGWLCRCDCGREVVYATGRLRAKHFPARSCGCLRGRSDWHLAPRIDRTGHRYGRLVVRAYEERGGVPGWAGRCDCGAETWHTVERYGNRPPTSCGRACPDATFERGRSGRWRRKRYAG